ncbi:MAG: serine/threonine-protein kinase [Myxococcota bacterium]
MSSPLGLGVASDPFEGTPYRALRRIGAGGMAEVFQVEHRQTRRVLVAKVLRDQLLTNEQLRHRFRIEGQVLARLRHSHIVAVLGYDATRDGRPFIVTEHLEGRSLAEELADVGRIPIHLAVLYASQVLSALAVAHEAGIVHRDIKPANIFITRRADELPRVKLIDFGVALLLPGLAQIEPLPDNLKTTTSSVVGTPRYVSPEGASGARVDGRADLYAVALVLYALIAGRGPFDHIEADHLLLNAHASEEPRPPSSFVHGLIPKELDRLVLRGLAKDPALRFQTAREFLAELEYVGRLVRLPAGWLETMGAEGIAVDSSTAVPSATRERREYEPRVVVPAKAEILAPTVLRAHSGETGAVRAEAPGDPAGLTIFQFALIAGAATIVSAAITLAMGGAW